MCVISNVPKSCKIFRCHCRAVLRLKGIPLISFPALGVCCGHGTILIDHSLSFSSNTKQTHPVSIHSQCHCLFNAFITVILGFSPLPALHNGYPNCAQSCTEMFSSKNGDDIYQVKAKSTL